MHTMSYCPICKKDLPNPYFAPELFTYCLSPEEHKSRFIDTGLLYEEAVVIRSVSEDVSFLEAMIDLKQKDPIEFQLKMSQFKATQSQTETVEDENNQVKCPNCKSTNIQIVPRKWSLLTGFMTNKTDRVCVNCKHKF